MKLELKHLAPYLPYGLQVNANNSDLHIENFTGEISSWEYYNTRFNVWNEYKIKSHMVSIESIKPILRPISSMTKEEAKEFSKLALLHCVQDDSLLLDLDVKTDKVSGTTINCLFREIIFNYIHTVTTYSICVCGDFIKIVDKEPGQVVSVSYSLYEWLFKHHFDVFNLIENNLAINKTKL